MPSLHSPPSTLTKTQPLLSSAGFGTQKSSFTQALSTLRKLHVPQVVLLIVTTIAIITISAVNDWRSTSRATPKAGVMVQPGIFVADGLLVVSCIMTITMSILIWAGHGNSRSTILANIIVSVFLVIITMIAFPLSALPAASNYWNGLINTGVDGCYDSCGVYVVIGILTTLPLIPYFAYLLLLIAGLIKSSQAHAFSSVNVLAYEPVNHSV